MVDILEIIPYGHENAVSRSYLSALTHMTDRKVRLAIQKERETHVILSTDDGNGYFRPTERDYEYVRMYHVRERARARTILDNLHPVMDFLRTHEGAVRSG